MSCFRLRFLKSPCLRYRNSDIRFAHYSVACFQAPYESSHSDQLRSKGNFAPLFYSKSFAVSLAPSLPIKTSLHYHFYRGLASLAVFLTCRIFNLRFTKASLSTQRTSCTRSHSKICSKTQSCVIIRGQMQT